MFDFTYVIAALACLPLVAMVIWAFATRHPRYNTKKILFFRNKAVAVGVFILIFIVFMVLVAWQTYELGGCIGGLLSSARCKYMPSWIGNVTHNIYFLGMIYLVVACLPTLLLLGIAEFISRHKHKQSLIGDTTD